MLSGVAVVATGLSVSGGVLNAGSEFSVDQRVVPAVEAAAGADVRAGVPAAGFTADDLADRARDDTSRSDRRTSSQSPAKVAQAAALGTAQGKSMAESESLDSADPRDIGRALLPEYGFSADQFSCLDALYVSESNWRVDADNPGSSAYGIPQAMTSVHDMPADYYTSAEAQIRWGLDYIKRTYGTPCGAWSFKQSHNWY